MQSLEFRYLESVVVSREFSPCHVSCCMMIKADDSITRRWAYERRPDPAGLPSYKISKWTLNIYLWPCMPTPWQNWISLSGEFHVSIVDRLAIFIVTYTHTPTRLTHSDLLHVQNRSTPFYTKTTCRSWPKPTYFWWFLLYYKTFWSKAMQLITL